MSHLRNTLVGLNSTENLGNKVYRLRPPRGGIASIQEENGIQPGDEVLVPFLQSDLVPMVIKEYEGSLVAEDSILRAYLKFDQGSWICDRLITKLVVSHLSSTD